MVRTSGVPMRKIPMGVTGVVQKPKKGRKALTAKMRPEHCGAVNRPKPRRATLDELDGDF